MSNMALGTVKRSIRHGLKLLWFKDLMNVIEKLQLIDPTFELSSLRFEGAWAELTKVATQPINIKNVES